MPENFVTLKLDFDYRTDRSRIGRDLVSQLLRGANAYDRAAGFFSSTSFRALGRELCDFFNAGGVMRLVCSPRVEANDLVAIKRAIVERSQVRTTWKTLDEAFQSQKWSLVLAYLIATDRIKIRVAVPEGPSNLKKMYHEKIAVIRDCDNNMVAMSGSANESYTGLSENFERVDVFPSWLSEIDKKRALRIKEQFRALWEDETDGLNVFDLTEAFRRDVWLISLDERDVSYTVGSESNLDSPPMPSEVLVPPPNLTLMEHQLKAIEAWGANGGRGMLEMATGSGKTITALSLATKVHDRLNSGFVILIIAPLIHLVDQWRDVALTFGLSPLRCAEGNASWDNELNAAISALNSGGRGILSIVTTSDTLSSTRFQGAISRIRKPGLVIADEVHNYGAPKTVEALPPNFALRLGLSATPNRWHDEAGTKALEGYFGPVVYAYSMEKAISDGVLTQYRYFPELAILDAEELEKYLDFTALLVRYMRSDGETDLNSGAKRLLIQRARVLASARSKLPLLKSILTTRRHESHILVYCGDGSVKGPVDESTVRQVEAAVRVLGVELKMRVAPYVAETKPAERRELLKAFQAGDIQALVAIRCLDEGVDIPVARTGVILASSTNPRQFIQRRGRLLRRAPGKIRADIFDLFAVPELSSLQKNGAQWRMARGIVGGQIPRAREFADLAENGPLARKKLIDICEKMNLLSFWGN